ncbi:unnamed protein product [Prunus brigantina]
MSGIASGTKDQVVTGVFQRKNGKYEDAEKSLTLALNYNTHCLLKVDIYKSRIPSSMSFEMNE